MVDDALTLSQRRILDFILDHRMRASEWPTLLYVQRALGERTNVRRELEALRARYGEYFAPRDLDHEIRLPTAAIADCGRADEFYALMPRIIAAARDAFYETEGSPVLTNAFLSERGWSEEDVAHAGRILRDDHLFTSGGGSSPNGVWHVNLTDEIHEYTGIQTPRDYLAAKLKHEEARQREYEARQRTRGKAVRARPTFVDGIVRGANSLPAVADASVFIVHGHDIALKLDVVRTVEQLGLTPIVLHERPDHGMTIIEKLETNADVDYAIILLTPDDEVHTPLGPRKRARQNVVLELGFFLARLGRERVFILRKDDKDLETPSDYDGVIYTLADAHGGWKLRLATNLRDMGFDVDANGLS